MCYLFRFFNLKEAKFSGILRRYKNKGYPKIELKTSYVNSNHPPKDALDFEDTGSHWVSNNVAISSHYFIVRIFNGTFRMTNYEIRSHKSDVCCMRGWKLEGSKDGSNYAMLDNRPENNDLYGNTVGRYPVNSGKNYYSYFRIKQTVKSTRDNRMRISGLDFYGEFLPFNKSLGRCTRNFAKKKITSYAFHIDREKVLWNSSMSDLHDVPMNKTS